MQFCMSLSIRVYANLKGCEWVLNECVVMKVTQSPLLWLKSSTLNTLWFWVFWDPASLAHLWLNSSAPFCAFHSAFSCQCPRLATESVTLLRRDAQNNPALLLCLLLQAPSWRELLWTICLFFWTYHVRTICHALFFWWLCDHAWRDGTLGFRTIVFNRLAQMTCINPHTFMPISLVLY